MIQDLIAYLIISIAFGALILHILRFFNIISKKPVNTSKCRGCSTGCGMKELHEFKKPKNYDQYRIQL
jgi:hypothetical protein